jgi:ribosomal protein S27E
MFVPRKWHNVLYKIKGAEWTSEDDVDGMKEILGENGGILMNCTRCGKRLVSSADDFVNGLCSDCRNDHLPTPKYFGFAQGWLCPKCGAVLAPNQGYCVFCAPTREITVAY